MRGTASSSVVTTFYWLRGLITGGADTLFVGQISLWLWFTVLFANFAEAMAEGRGKAQADALRKTKTDTYARRLTGGAKELARQAAFTIAARGFRRESPAESFSPSGG